MQGSRRARPEVLAGGGGAPACERGGRTRWPGCLAGVAGRTRLACWLGRAGRRGRTRPRRGGWQARAKAGAAGRLPCCAARRTATARPRGPRRRIYPALPRHGSGRGTTAPRSVARQSPAPSAVSASGHCHVSPLSRHHAWRGTGIWPRQGNRRDQKC